MNCFHHRKFKLKPAYRQAGSNLKAGSKGLSGCKGDPGALISLPYLRMNDYTNNQVQAQTYLPTGRFKLKFKSRFEMAIRA